MQDFSDIAKKIEKRASAVTEALQQESESSDQVEQTLNKRYQQSVTNVLNSLKDSMDVQEKKLIKHRTNEALDLITDMTREAVIDTKKRMEGLRKNTTSIRKEMLEEEQLTLQKMKQLNQELTQIQNKQWIIPSIVGLSLVVALMMGTWGVTKYLSSKLQTLQELEETIQQTKKTQNRYMKKAWSNAVGVKDKPKIQYSEKEALWIVYFENIQE